MAFYDHGFGFFRNTIFFHYFEMHSHILPQNQSRIKVRKRTLIIPVHEPLIINCHFKERKAWSYMIYLGYYIIYCQCFGLCQVYVWENLATIILPSTLIYLFSEVSQWQPEPYCTAALAVVILYLYIASLPSRKLFLCNPLSLTST